MCGEGAGHLHAGLICFAFIIINVMFLVPKKLSIESMNPLSVYSSPPEYADD